MEKPNVEKIVIAWLTSIAGEDWPVYGDKPQESPDQFILVDRTGGAREAMVLDMAEILIEVYHKKSRMIASDKASDIADQVPNIVAADDSITRSVVNSQVNLADILSGYERYQIYCDVFCRR